MPQRYAPLAGVRCTVARNHGTFSRIRHAARGVGLCVLAGLLLANLLAWSLALTVRQRILPRTAEHVFVSGDGVWHVSIVKGAGYEDHFWSGFAPPTGENSPEEVAEDLRTLMQLRRSAQDTVLVSPSRPRWGSLADASADLRPAYDIGADCGFGWPMPALAWRVRGEESGTLQTGGMSIIKERLEWGVPISGTPSVLQRDFKALPLRPIWIGMVTNTLLASVLVGAVWFGVPAIRRTLRVRRGLCPWCGYDRSGAQPESPCPECAGTTQSPPRPAVAGGVPHSRSGTFGES